MKLMVFRLHHDETIRWYLNLKVILICLHSFKVIRGGYSLFFQGGGGGGLTFIGVPIQILGYQCLADFGVKNYIYILLGSRFLAVPLAPYFAVRGPTRT